MAFDAQSFIENARAKGIPDSATYQYLQSKGLIQGAQTGATTQNTQVQTQQTQKPYQPAVPFSTSQGVGGNAVAAAANIIPSAINLGSNLVGSPKKAVSTGASVVGGYVGGAIGSSLDEFIGPLGTLGGAWIGSIIGNSIANQKNPIDELGSLVNYFKNTYSSPQALAQKVTNDPAGAALDFSMISDLAGASIGTIGTIAKTGADTGAEAGAETGARVASKPNALQSVGSTIQNAASWTNPISFPFKAMGALGGSTSETSNAATNVQKETGVNIGDALTAGMKKGGLPSLLEGIAAWLPGGSTITEKATNAMNTIQDAATNFGSQIISSIQKSGSEGDSVESIVSNVASDVKQSLTSLKSMTSRGYDSFFKTYGDTPVTMDRSPDSSLVQSVQGIFDKVSNGILDESLGKQFNNILKKNGIDISNVGNEFMNWTQDASGNWVKQAAEGGAGDVTLQNLKNVSDWVGNQIGKARGYGTKALSQLNDAVNTEIGNTLKDAQPAEGRTASPLDEWNQLGQSWHSVMGKFQDSTYQSLQKVLGGAQGAAGNAGQLLEKVFGNMRSDANMKNWQDMVGPDGINKMGIGYLFKKVQDAFEDPQSGKTNGDIMSGNFNPQKFLDGISKAPDSVWKNILAPEDYKMMQWAKNNSGDLQTLFNSLKGLERYAAGSRTAPTGITYRRFVAPLMQSGFDIAKGGLGAAATAGWDAGTWLLGSWLFSRTMGSDWMQSLMGGDTASKLTNALQAIGNSKGVQMGGAVQNQSQTSMRNTLSTQQLMNLMKTIQQNPGQASTIIQQGQQMGYYIPQELINATSSAEQSSPPQ